MLSYVKPMFKGYTMKLQKASKPILTYPKREHIKPILLSATVAMALTSCTPSPAGKMPNNSEANCTASQNQEIKYPDNIAGGMPVFVPEENNQTWGHKPKK